MVCDNDSSICDSPKALGSWSPQQENRLILLPWAVRNVSNLQTQGFISKLPVICQNDC